MNCVNHPETPVAAYCQNCGKPLCTACVRQVANVTYCEPCLAAKLGVPGAAPGAYQVKVGDTAGKFQYSATGPLPMGLDAGPNPGLATLLGFIPGVGAMYNGQFVKALVHVLVFVVLIMITSEYGVFGIFIAAWVFYQVFDSYHTAKARRDGMPLPDPLGLNELGIRLGIQHRTTQAYGPAGYPPISTSPGAAPFAPENPAYPDPAYPPPLYAAPGTPAAGADPAYTAVPPAHSPEGYPPYDPAQPPPTGPRPEPIGAIILIALGVLFLLGTMNIFDFNWIHRGWPLILIGLGIWIFIKRSRELPPGGGL